MHWQLKGCLQMHAGQCCGAVDVDPRGAHAQVLPMLT